MEENGAVPAAPQTSVGRGAISVRPATPDDALVIAQLWRTCTGEVAAHEPIYTPALSVPELAVLFGEVLATGRCTAWVAEADGMLAGYVTCRVEDEAPVFRARKYVYVIDLDVAPEFRRRGVSRVLMAEVERHALALGIRRLELTFAVADPRPAAVWARHGFRPHLIHMHKDL